VTILLGSSCELKRIVVYWHFNELPMNPKPQSALVILGHGSTVNPDSSAPTLAHAAE